MQTPVEDNLDMRTTNGLTRRSHAALEEGGSPRDDTDFPKSQSLLPIASTTTNSFRDAIRFMSNSGPAVFTVALVVSFFATLKSGSVLHTTNTFFNFLHVWATITLMVLSIMGLMNALKNEV